LGLSFREVTVGRAVGNNQLVSSFDVGVREVAKRAIPYTKISKRGFHQGESTLPTQGQEEVAEERPFPISN